MAENQASRRPTLSRSYAFQPGSHSHNSRRLAAEEISGTAPLLKWIKRFSFVIGFACLGFYLFTAGDQYFYQAYENWAFDQAIAGHAHLGIMDYLRHELSLPPASELKTGANVGSSTLAGVNAHPADGDPIARISIDRLNLTAIVREGVSPQTLTTAVGHVASTALPGQPGNFAIAAHRDTLFRGLKDIRNGDKVTVQSTFKNYVYEVFVTKVVRPTDVKVLDSDGGGLYLGTSVGKPEELLTMITCFPFRYVGAAPQRFVVEAKLISTAAAS